MPDGSDVSAIELGITLKSREVPHEQKLPSPKPVDLAFLRPRVEENSTEINPLNGDKELIDSSVVMNPTARKAWGFLVHEHPDLQSVIVLNSDPSFELRHPRINGRYIHPSSSNESPKILLARDWKRAISFLRSDGHAALEIMAARIGVAPIALTDDMLATFLLAHEGGHAVDQKGQTKEYHQKQRTAETAHLPARNTADFLRKYPNASQQALSKFLAMYRKVPSEARADDFAASFVRRHLDLFTKPTKPVLVAV